MNPRDELHRLAYLATASHTDANKRVERIYKDGLSLDELVCSLFRQLAEELHRVAYNKFSDLDNILRSDLTTADRLTKKVRQDLLWELKRTCLVQTLGCLPAQPRITFILCDVYGASIERAAAIFGVNEAAVHVRLTRARGALRDFLEHQCVHLDGKNPCTCTGRLGVALRKGFIGDKPTNPTPEFSHRARFRVRRSSELYASLPILRPDGVS